MLTDSNTRALQALRSKLELQEETAGKALANAVSAHATATGSLAEAADRTAVAERAWRAARESGTARASISALALAELAGFVAVQRAHWQAAVAHQKQQSALLVTRAGELTIARRALATARGEREAVENRIAAHVAEVKRVAEAKTEDEAADRHAAVHKRLR